MTGQSYHSFQATHPDTKDRVIKADLMASSLERGKKNLTFNREVYLSKIKGLEYGGKPREKRIKNYKPQYIDIYEVHSQTNSQ